MLVSNVYVEYENRLTRTRGNSLEGNYVATTPKPENSENLMLERLFCCHLDAGEAYQ